jgi:predicted Holliday junction resolvase-like endonuclease
MNLILLSVAFAALLAVAVVVFVIGYRMGKGTTGASRREFEARSRATMRGQIAEHFAPLLPGFPRDLKASEARFIGKPVDFLVFKGMDEQNITELVFVEIKTGKARLTNTEKQVRSAIMKKRVRWHECRTNLLSLSETVEARRSA